MLTCQTIIERLSQNRELVKAYGITDIGVYGPYVLNEQTSKSSIGIIIECADERNTYDNLSSFRFFLETLLESRVELAVYQPFEIKN